LGMRPIWSPCSTTALLALCARSARKVGMLRKELWLFCRVINVVKPVYKKRYERSIGKTHLPLAPALLLPEVELCAGGPCQDLSAIAVRVDWRYKFMFTPEGREK